MRNRIQTLQTWLNHACRIVGIVVVVLLAKDPAWALQVTPSSLTFTVAAGAPDPATQNLTLGNNRSRERNWFAAANVPWITLTPASGTINTEHDLVTVRVTSTGLAAGTYSGTVTITETSFGSRTRRSYLPVALTVTGSAPSAAMQLSPSALSFGGLVGGANPASQAITVSSTGVSSLAWTASDNAPWLTLSPSTGAAPGTVTAAVSLAGLAAGTYNAAITLSAPGVSPKTVPVTLSVTAVSTGASIWNDPSIPAFTGTVGGTPPAAQTITINSTGSAIAWTASENTPWLSLSPSSGSTPGRLTLTVNPAGLAAGTYNGLITLSAPSAANNPKYIPVSLTLSAPVSSSPVIGYAPANLTFSGMAGGANPTAQTLSITNAGTGTLSWSAGDNAAWLTLTPGSGTNAGSVTANVNTAGMAAGTYSAAINLSATGATAKTVPVTLTVSAGGTGSATLSWAANTEPDLAGYRVYVGTQSGTYGPPISVGKVTLHTINSLVKGMTYFFTVTAVDGAGNESPPAAELSKSIF